MKSKVKLKKTSKKLEAKTKITKLHYPSMAETIMDVMLDTKAETTDCTPSSDTEEQQNGAEEKPDGESRAEKAFFNPPLSIQRYQRVCEIAAKLEVKSVLDLGCGECRLVQRLKNVSSVERITGVDIDELPVRLSKHRCRPLPSDHLCPRSRPLVIELYHGDITNLDSRIYDHEMIAMVEVVEHLLEDELSKFPPVVFGKLNPKYCIVTTPNFEYNVVFESGTRLRHWDHKFEWTRAEFQAWAKTIASTYDYAVNFEGVGDPPDDRDIGFCTQIAVFERRSETKSEKSTSVTYTQMCSETFAYRSERQILREKVCEEMERILPTVTIEDELNEIALDELFERFTVKDLCSRDELKNVLKEVGYVLSDCEQFLLYDTRESYTMWSDDDCYGGGQFSDASDDATSAINFHSWTDHLRECEIWD